MVSNLTNSNGTAAHGDMLYALTEATKALQGFAYSSVSAYAAEVPADMGAMHQGVRIVLDSEEKLKDAKNIALERVPAGPVGSYSAVQAIIKKIEACATIEGVMQLAAELNDVCNSKEREHNEMYDPEVEQAKRIDRLFQRLDELNKKVDEAFEEFPLTEEQKKLRASNEEALKAAQEAFKKDANPETLAALESAVKASQQTDKAISRDLAASGHDTRNLDDKIGARDEFTQSMTSDLRAMNSEWEIPAKAPQVNETAEQRAEAEAGLAMVRQSSNTAQTPLAAVPIIQGTVTLPMLQGVVVAEVEAPEEKQLASLTRAPASETLGLRG